MRKPLLSGSILDADFACVVKHVREAVKGGVDILHFDVADTSYTPTISFGPRVVASIARESQVPGEVHLMVEKPEHLVDQFSGSGVERLYFHLEATRTPYRLIQKIADEGLKPAVALNPSARVELVEPLLPHLDAVLILLVEPGLGGQRMLTGALSKATILKELREREKLDFLITVDGGVKLDNISQVVKAGVDVIVVGSAIFAGGDPFTAAQTLKKRILEESGRTPLDT